VIPAFLIQFYAIISSGSRPSSTATFSLFFCIFTASFISAVITLDWDANQGNRKFASLFYEYFPEGSKRKVAACVSLLSLYFFDLVVRSLACVFFVLKGGMSLAVVIILAELLFYFLTKIMAQDCRYWVPIYGLKGGLLTVLCRTVIKLVTDLTALVHFRCPHDLGGASFSFSLVTTIGMGIFSTLYYADVKESGDQRIWDEESIVLILGTWLRRRRLLRRTPGLNKEGGEAVREARLEQHLLNKNNSVYIYNMCRTKHSLHFSLFLGTLLAPSSSPPLLMTSSNLSSVKWQAKIKHNKLATLH